DRWRGFSSTAALLGILAVAACDGEIGASHDAKGPGTSAGGTVTPPPPPVDTNQGLDGAGPYPLPPLPPAEDVNTLRDLSGGVVQVNPDDLPTDSKGASGFTSDVTLSQVEVDQLLGVAMSSAQALSQKLAARFPCDTSGGKEEACALDFAKRAGQL